MPSQSACHWFKPNLGLSFLEEMKKSAHVIASHTGRLNWARSASAYGGSSVHSKTIALMDGSSLKMPLTISIMPGVTNSTSTCSPFATASKPGMFWQPLMMKRVSSTSKPHWLSRMSFCGFKVSPFAVRIKILSYLSKATETIGHWTIEDMKTGMLTAVRASGWKAIMNPQSPVMPQQPLFSRSLQAFMNSSCTFGVIFPDCAMAKVRPGTHRYLTS
mmetsp:Transcript_60239/g.184007  ORF Transcript_60239/g.184007 Transcript_60239/m.184007 type:complete len:217 (-) Transcript_60239:1448-2098(-)